jgi:putative oxidoreductase
MHVNFDFANGYVVLRIICGLFFIPHGVGKFTARAASIGFFTAAGFKPPALWAYSAMVIETLLGLMLILGLLTRPAAYLSALYLLIAAIANYKVSRKWLWHIGGSEWPVFWAICCAIVGYYGAAAGA